MKLEVKEHNINLSLDQCYHKMRFLFCFLEEGPLNNEGLKQGDQGTTAPLTPGGFLEHIFATTRGYSHHPA